MRDETRRQLQERRAAKAMEAGRIQGLLDHIARLEGLAELLVEAVRERDALIAELQAPPDDDDSDLIDLDP